MSMTHRYAIPVELTEWKFEGKTETSFTWDYDVERDQLLTLYDKGKRQQWDAALRIDWSRDLSEDNPMELDDRTHPLFGSDMWNRMNAAEKVQARRHYQAASTSQFLHGEQGALIAVAKIVQTVPDIDSKFYAATQMMDEARHVEAFSRLLKEKFELAYPISPALKWLLETGLGDSRWDMTYLTMQVLVEGLALSAFHRLRDYAGNPLAAQVHAYVMQDEARHVAFGRIALRDFYPHLTEAERGERESFVVEACYAMRDRFDYRDVWERLGLPGDKAVEAVRASDAMQRFRKRLFSRVVPTIKDIGLWGPKVRAAFEDLGVLDFANIDAQALLEEDNQIAEDFDPAKHVALSMEQPPKIPMKKPGS